MPTVGVKIIGLDPLILKMKLLRKGLLDLSPELAAVGKELVDYYAAAFPAQGSMFGQQWNPLKPSTLKYKTAHATQMKGGVSPSQPLVFSGKMQDSFKFAVTPVAMRVYNDVEGSKDYNYFKAHQLGLGHNPKRVMIALNVELVETIRKTIAGGIRARIEAA
jgi:hypothetical protein